MTFKQYLFNKNYSNETIRKYVQEVHQFEQFLESDISQATYNEIMDYMRFVQSKVTNKTAEKKLAALKNYFDYLIQIGENLHNPAAHIKIKGIQRRQLYDILKPSELESLYHQFPHETTIEKRNKVMIGLLVFQGITTADLQNLRPEDLQLREGIIHIPETKKSNYRDLLLKPYQLLDFQEYLLQIRPNLNIYKREVMFLSSEGNANLSNTIAKLLPKIQRIEPKVKSLNQIRSSVITRWIQGTNLREAQYRAGHRFISSTEKYKVNDIEDLKEDLRKFFPI